MENLNLAPVPPLFPSPHVHSWNLIPNLSALEWRATRVENLLSQNCKYFLDFKYIQV